MVINKDIYSFDIFKDSDIICAISTRSFGSIKEKSKINKNNLKKFADVLGIDAKNVVFPKQVHGSKIAFVSSPVSENITGSADGLITNKNNLFLGVLTADCLPVVFYGKGKSIIGIVHAGYKGILKGIIQKMLKKLTDLNCDVSSIKVGIGPSIGACCYAVPYERIKMFKEKYPNLKTHKKEDGGYFLDLKNIVFQILINEGIKKDNIEISPLCAKCNIQTFFSFRGDTKETFGEFATVIGML